MPKTAPFVGLLDLYPSATAAYSLRRLSADNTENIIRVRRSSDNAEQNFGYNSSNVLDTAAVLSFCGAGNGFITTWYDQSGFLRHATQTTAANQPQIVSSGAIITTNSKPSLFFDGSNDSFNIASTISVGTSNYTSFVAKRDASTRRLIGISGGQGGAVYLHALWTDNKYYLQAKTTHYQVSNSTDTTTSQLLLTGLNNAGTMAMYKNGGVIASSQVATAISLTINAIGIYSGPNYTFGNIQEVIFYNSEQSANRTGIESNINTYYTIY